jgi:hypothetical protein
MEENEAPQSSPNTAPTQATAAIKSRPRAAVSPQEETAPCPTCGTGMAPNGGGAPSYIYALGRIEARFPSAGVEKEFAQATGRAKTSSQTDREAFAAVLGQRENRYLLRQLCWVLTIQGLETYLLQPRDSADIDLLLGAVRPAPNALDIDAVIGLRGPMAPPEMCNGLMVPIVAFDQIYSFDREALLGAIPRPAKTPAKEFKAAADELFDRILQLTDNAGATDDHRALNYLAMRYPAIYSAVADAYGRNASLTGVEVRPSALSGTRNVVDVVFTFTNRNTDVDEKFFVRVDVTEEFPFLVTKLSPYYDH